MTLTLLVLLGFATLVGALAYLSHRTGTDRAGCCAPADPALDKRMRDAFE